MAKIYCNYCGKETTDNKENCPKCKESLNPNKKLWKEYLKNHIKDDLKGKVEDNAISLIKNYLLSHMYGTIMTILIIGTIAIASIALKDNYPPYIENVNYGKEEVLSHKETNNKKPKDATSILKFMKDYEKTNKSIVDNPSLNSGYIALLIDDLDGDAEDEGLITSYIDGNINFKLVAKEKGKVKVVAEENIEAYHEKIDGDKINEHNILIKKENKSTTLFMEYRTLDGANFWLINGFTKYVFENNQIKKIPNQVLRNEKLAFFDPDSAEMIDYYSRALNEFGLTINTLNESVIEQNSDVSLIGLTVRNNNESIAFERGNIGKDYRIK